MGLLVCNSSGNLETWKALLKERLSSKRFEHSLSVSQTASALAYRHGYDSSLAALAGLLHDYARDMSEEDLLDFAEANKLIGHPVERQVPVLLHGPVGAFLVREELGVCDREVIEAIAYHTTGAPGMSALAGIVYLADMIEPLRDFPGVAALRNLAENDLQSAILAGLDSAIGYCMDLGMLIHPISIEARNSLLIQKKDKPKEGCF